MLKENFNPTSSIHKVGNYGTKEFTYLLKITQVVNKGCAKKSIAEYFPYFPLFIFWDHTSSFTYEEKNHRC